MADRRWTVMLIPHGSDSPRTISVSERSVRIGAWLLAVFTLVGAIGIGTLIADIGRFVSPAPMAGGPRVARRSELLAVAARVAALRDTIAVIKKREEQIRLLAGLPATDSLNQGTITVDSATGEVLSGSSSTSAAPLDKEMRGDVDALLARATMLSSRFAEVTDSLTSHSQRLANTPSIMPTAGWLTSHFSRRRYHPILHTSRPHEGIDVTAPHGAPIVAPAAGTVVSAGTESGYGLIVEIDHGNGIVTKYAHCSRILVRRGQRVTRGQTIAAVGSTGLSTGPHLHYEIHVNGRVVDPLTYVLPAAIPD